MLPELEAKAETVSSLRARAERCRAMARLAPLPFAAQMLLRLAEQFEGEAQRRAAGPNPRPAADRGRAPLGASA
ncbi:MAG: hypothetical protein ACREFQ_19215 [Stellaceae bacterium]